MPSPMRKRRQSPRRSSFSINGSINVKKLEEDIVWGKTPGGTVFRVPTTHDVLTALFHPSYPKSHFDLLNLALLGMQLILFVMLPKPIARLFFAFYFAFWRLTYDAGLGWILTRQSKKKWIVRQIVRRGWLDKTRNPKMREWIRRQLVGKMGSDYSFDDLPVEYNSWLLFRQLVDVILLNDFLSYCMFAFSCFRVPDGLSIPMHAMRWAGGIALITFNLWVKTEAHHVVKDYGWYWGDVFFQRGALVFDGVFEMAPHPMYSVGYAGYYGLTIIVGSYPVLFVSLAAHACQFAFLVLFENPHIERMYGQRKPIAMRVPLSTLDLRTPNEQTPMQTTPPTHSRTLSAQTDISTPTATEGDTATETETELECLSSVPSPTKITSAESEKPRSCSISQHDLFNIYFRHDVINLRNIDLFRASDLKLVLIIGYAIICAFLPSLDSRSMLALYFIHALFWRFFHSFALGFVLRAQSRRKYVVRHFLEHYHYPPNDGGAGAIQEAFTNWKEIYNLSLVMTNVSFLCLAWKTYYLPEYWTVGDALLRHTLGFLLIGLHIWMATESLEVLGVFGWFFGDFFIENYPTTLQYTGIYRFLNNPERTMSGAAFFGLALISGSKIVFAMALISVVSHWWFLSKVENPHMRKVYGDSLRKEAGLTKMIKIVALKNAKLLESSAGKHGPDLRRVAREVRGTFEKVYGEAAEVVEDFIATSTPKLSEVVQDTKFLLQQTKERLVISRFARDLSFYDITQYDITIIPSPTAAVYSPKELRFHLGEPIKISWRAPSYHSRRDWIGIYRLGANASTLVTKTSSQGHWVPVYNEEWEGDVFVGDNSPGTPTQNSDCGEVVLQKEALPWRVGCYEIRYHHDAKHNVMSLSDPIEIYLDPPSAMDFDSVRSWLLRNVTWCLDSDPSLIPSNKEESGNRDPDDFRFWSEKQAKRITGFIKEALDIEYQPEVIVADANISALANRILVSKQILSS